MARPGRLVRVPGGRFTTGTDRPVFSQDGESHRRTVEQKPFLIDPCAVTNAWFEEFVVATGYRTEAERIGWSAVFCPDGPGAGRGDAPTWWGRVDGADWRSPNGPGSAAFPQHPVVQVSWVDASAFATWAGGRLPTEVEWECAAAGGLRNPRYPWGEAEPDDSEFLPCNIWQGTFPSRNTAADGFIGTAPVDAFAANGFGLFNMVGNTWEWCADGFRVRSLARGTAERNAAARRQEMRVLKGGSYLCHRSYCHRYRIAARSGASPDSATPHVGFRIVFDTA
ncbi:MAG TPA: formylglycine-generating enzyme family protein [Acetobacteraceae bacterium]|nr:formylglycine-generating enzyme family protein [Acetobacteraceae bacterium]